MGFFHKNSAIIAQKIRFPPGLSTGKGQLSTVQMKALVELEEFLLAPSLMIGHLWIRRFGLWTQSLIQDKEPAVAPNWTACRVKP